MRNHRLKSYIYAVLLLLLSFPAFAAKQYASSTEGTEFWAVFANNRKFLADDATLHIELHVITGDAMRVVVEDAAGVEIDAHDFEEGGGEFIFQLSPDQAYIEPIMKSGPINNQQPVNKGVRVYTEDLTASFSCFGYIEAGVSGNTSRDAILFLPLTAWGKEYVTQTYNEDATSTFFVVLASENQTTVTITPKTTTFLNVHQADEAFTVTLNRGQSIMIPSLDRDAAGGESIDLSGSFICADKPVAVFNGNQETKIPLKDEYSGDHTYEQALVSNRWGTEFYVARAGKTKANKLSITAAYDQTEVTIKRSLSPNNVATSVVMLNGGESYTTDIPDRVTSASVTSTMPVTCYSYLTSGGNNQETIDFDPETLEDIKINWGNPTNAMIPSWNQRVKEASFFTRALVPQSAVEPQHHFVQVVTAESDVDKVVLDGVPVDPIRFTAMAVNNYMAVANIELSTHGKHTISTSGSGLVGFVHGLTGGQAYQYTLGYCPNPYRDSLFITDDGVMSPLSYDIDPIEGKGLYQRQLADWPFGEERLDTAYICDSTTLHFSSQMADNYRNDSIVWHIYSYDPETSEKMMVRDSLVVLPDMLTQTLEHLFTLDLEKDRTPEMRDPKQLFEVEYLMYRSHLVCDELEPIIDTLTTMVEVHRQYRDTILQRVICAGDSVRCFFDTGITFDSIWWTRSNVDEENDSTTFVGNAPESNRQEQYVLGDNLFTRKYQTIYGCDSIMMFYLHVCDTFLEFDTISFCEGDTLYYKNEKEFFYSDKPNQTFTGGIYLPGTYIDTLKTVQCKEYEAIDPTFHGCDSVRILTVLQCDTFYMPTTDVFCTNGVGKYLWQTKVELEDGTIRYDNRKDPNGFYIDENTKGMEPDTRIVIEDGIRRLDTISWSGVFYDSLKRVNKCDKCLDYCDSIYELRLTIPNHYVVDQWASYCDSSYVDMGATFQMERNDDYHWLGHTKDPDDPSRGRSLWWIKRDETSLNRIFPEDSLRFLPVGKYIFYDSLKSVHGCDSVHILHLTVRPTFFRLEQKIIPDNEVYTWTGHLDEDGSTRSFGPFTGEEGITHVYHDSATAQTKCDSIYRLELTIASHFFYPTKDTICANDTYTWAHNNKTYYPDSVSKAGTYDFYDRHKTTSLPVRDSIYHLHLVVKPTYRQVVSAHICDGGTYTFEDSVYHQTAAWEGDAFEQIVEDSVMWATETPGKPCDSLLVLDLHIWRSYETRDTIRPCQNVKADSVEWVGHKGLKYSIREADTIRLADLNLTKDSRRAKQCDSNAYLVVIVEPVYKVDTAATVCALNTPFVWRQYQCMNSGEYADTVPSIHGCDSITVLTLTVLDNTPKTLDTTVCHHAASFTFGAQQWFFSPQDSVNKDTTYIRSSVQSIAGECDYTETLLIHLRRTYEIPLTDTVCRDTLQYYTWSQREGRQVWSVLENKRINSTEIPIHSVGPHTYIDSTRTRTCDECADGGCDSVMILSLTVLPSYYSYLDTIISDEDSYYWPVNKVTYVGPKNEHAGQPGYVVASEPINYYDTLCHTAAVGTHICDSNYYLTLRVGKVFRDTAYAVTCAGSTYDWHIISPITGEDVLVQSGIEGETDQHVLVYDSLQTSFGFDSIYVLDLYTTKDYRYLTESDTVCQREEVYQWHGKEVDVTIDGEQTVIDAHPTEQTYLVRASGETEFTPYTPACDSIWTLHLYVMPTYNELYHKEEVTDSSFICDNDSVTWERRLYVGAKFTEYYGVTLPSKDAHYDTLIYVVNDTLDYWKDTTAFGKAHPEDACDSLRFLELHMLHITYDTLRVATICNNEDTTIGSDRYRFVWDHSFVLSAGDSHDSILVLYDTVQNAADCDSVARLTLTVHPSYAFAVEYDTICQYGTNTDVDSTYTWFTLNPAGDSVAHQLQISTRHHGDYVYVDSLHTMNGCDSIHTLALHIDSVYHIYDDTAKVSDEEYIEWEHQLYIGEQYLIAHPGAVVPDTAITYHHDTLLIRPYESAAGCDSIRYIYIRVGKVFRDTTYDYTCDNCVYTWRTNNAHGWRPTQSGLDSTIWEGLPTQDTLILDKYETTLGFDSIYYLSLHIVPSYRTLDSTAYACQEDTAYIWPRHESVHVSLLRDTVFDVKDSLRTYLEVPVRRYGSPDFVNERTACDSIWTLHMHVTPTYDRRFHTDEVTDLIPICDNDSVTWERRLYVGAKFTEYHGVALPSKAAHYDTLIYVVNDTLDYWTDTTAFGKAHPEYACDSMRFLDLRVSHISYDTTLVQTICNNEAFTFGTAANRFVWDHSRVYYSNAITGTDTTFQLFDTVPNRTGCDSVTRLTLTVHPSYLIITDTTICGSDAELFNWRQKNYRVTGIYDDTCHTTSYNCDSIYRLRLTVLPTFVYNTVENICEGDTIDFYGEPVYALPSDFGPGMVTRYVEAQLPNIMGCNNIYRLYPFFYHRYFFSDTVRLCDNETYTWTGHRHDTVLTPKPGYGQEIYYDSLMSHVTRLHPFYPDSMVRFGCDSVYELVLVHSSTFSFADTFHVCQYEPFSWPEHTRKGEFATPHAGEFVYYDSLQTTMALCDSVWTLHLMVDSVYIIDSVFTICDNDSVRWQGRTYHLPAGEYTDTVRFSSVYHCDSLHTMQLTVYPTYTAVTDSQTICDSESYSFVGRTYPAFSWRTAHHTDTVLQLDTVIPSIHGCDSAVHHVLTVHPTYYYYDTTHVFCTGESYSWQYRTYLPDSAGVIRDTARYSTIHGCDSIYYLRLIYHQSYFWNEDDTICGDYGIYAWHRHTIHIDPRETNYWPDERTFIYYDSLVSVYGCDSVYRLQLTVQPVRYIEVDSTMCYGEYYTSPSGRYRWTESGLYRDTTLSAWGCHIFHTIRLTMLKPTRYTFSEPRACADLEYLTVPFSFVGTAPVSYSIFFDSLALSQLFYNQPSVALTPGDNHLEIDMPVPSSDRRQYVRPDHYTATIYMDNGVCRDSALMTFPFSFDVQYPSWITEQHWNDAIGILVPELNGYDAVTHTGYSFASYQWYRDGQILYGETKPYLYAPHGLTDAGSEYSVYLVREGETQGYFSCPLTPTPGTSEVIPTMPYISVVPTIVDHRRAEVNILSTNSGFYTIHTSYGVQVGYGRFVPDQHQAFAVRLPSTEGVYVFHLVDDSGLERNVKVIVE